MMKLSKIKIGFYMETGRLYLLLPVVVEKAQKNSTSYYILKMKSNHLLQYKKQNCFLRIISGFKKEKEKDNNKDKIISLSKTKKAKYLRISI